MEDKNYHRRILIRRGFYPLLFVLALWVVKLVEVIFSLDFSNYGLYPMELKGLRGMLFTPFIHGSWQHLFNNSIPVFFLAWTLNYFYHEISAKVFFLIYFIHTFWLWFFGREAFHIGASGVVYGLATFLFVSGLIRKNSNLLAISLLVAFLYGSMVWGIFPLVEEVSWEAHLTGMVAGFFLAFFYKNYGPPPNIGRWRTAYLYEEEQADSEANMHAEFWNQAEELENEDRNPQ